MVTTELRSAYEKLFEAAILPDLGEARDGGWNADQILAHLLFGRRPPPHSAHSSRAAALHEGGANQGLHATSSKKDGEIRWKSKQP